MARRPRVQMTVTQLEDRTTPTVLAPGIEYVDTHILVGFVAGQEAVGLASVNDPSIVSRADPIGFGMYKLTLVNGVSVQTARTSLAGRIGVDFAEPDYKLFKASTPNDPSFVDGTLWAHQNTGQNGGTAGADSRSVAGWDFGVGTGQTIVAIIDDGVQYTHPDLQANMWTNPGEIAGNGIDDDNNGFIDDIHGWDFTRNTGDILGGIIDDHGTHVAGTVGAVGNNGIGVVGSAWKTRMMTVPLFSSGANSGLTSVAIQAFDYAIRMGSKLSNNSWGNSAPFNFPLAAAMGRARAAGHIVVAAAGNDGVNNDFNNSFPSNFARFFDNVVSVAAFDRNDRMASFSQYGRQTVTLGAPGVSIYSTVLNGQYGFKDGTSMATPQVSGALAAFWDANPSFTYDEVVDALKRSVRKVPDATNKTVTDGVLDLEGLMLEGRAQFYATGAGEGGGPHVKVYRGRGREVASFMAYDPGLTGGVRVTTGDVNGDRVTDIITVAGPGGAPHVKVFDGRTFAEIFSFFAFEPGFTGGLNVAAADLNGDGRADIIVGAEAGGGPRVSAFSLPTGATDLVRIADFMAYDPGFTGGVRVAAGLFTPGSKLPDIVVAPGFGGGPHIRVFSGPNLLAGRAVVTAETFVGDANSRGGLFVAAGDFNNDGVADVVTGDGADTNMVRILDGRSMSPFVTMRSPNSGELPGLTNPAGPFQVGATTPPTLANGLLPPGGTPGDLISTNPIVKPVERNGYMFGVRVTVQDINGDTRPDLILGGGPNDTPAITLIDGATLAEIRHFNVYSEGFYGGVYVGAVNI